MGHQPISMLSSNDNGRAGGASNSKINKNLRMPPPYNLKKVVELPQIGKADFSPEKLNPVTTSYKVNDYYSNFMRDHFLVEQRAHGKAAAAAEEPITTKLKSRLQDRTKISSSTTRAANRTALMSPHGEEPSLLS